MKRRNNELNDIKNIKKDKIYKNNALEFFCGIGGFHSALNNVNNEYNIIAAYDINPNSSQVYRLNFPDTKLYNCDICGLTYLFYKYYI